MGAILLLCICFRKRKEAILDREKTEQGKFRGKEPTNVVVNRFWLRSGLFRRIRCHLPGICRLLGLAHVLPETQLPTSSVGTSQLQEVAGSPLVSPQRRGHNSAPAKPASQERAKRHRPQRIGAASQWRESVPGQGNLCVLIFPSTSFDARSGEDVTKDTCSLRNIPKPQNRNRSGAHFFRRRIPSPCQRTRRSSIFHCSRPMDGSPISMRSFPARP